MSNITPEQQAIFDRIKKQVESDSNGLVEFDLPLTALHPTYTHKKTGATTTDPIELIGWFAHVTLVDAEIPGEKVIKAIIQSPDDLGFDAYESFTCFIGRLLVPYMKKPGEPDASPFDDFEDVEEIGEEYIQKVLIEKVRDFQLTHVIAYPASYPQVDGARLRRLAVHALESGSVLHIDPEAEPGLAAAYMAGALNE